MKQAILTGLCLIIALEHFAFAILEMFLWDTKLGARIFKKDRYFLKSTRALAANQGLYNSFLGAGLLLSLAFNPPFMAYLVFFLSCIFVAGIFGALTVNMAAFWVQAMPAIIALILCFI